MQYSSVSRKRKDAQQINPPTNAQPKTEPPTTCFFADFYAFYLIILSISNITSFFP